VPPLGLSPTTRGFASLRSLSGESPTVDGRFLDDLDTGVAERVEQLVELFGRGDLRRKQVVDLVEEEIASFLADDDQLLISS